MINRKWKTFEKLTGKCYNNLIGVEVDGSCWQQAFEILKEIIQEERQRDPNYAPQLEMLEDATDYEYDIQGWLEDCLDEVDMREEHEVLLSMCDDLLQLFGWPDYTDSDLKFRKSGALKALGRQQEAVKYCKKWIQDEPENIVAATAGVYAFIDSKEYDAAEELVGRFIIDRSKCTEENDIMFTAASRLYDTTGNKQEKKRIDQAIKKYEEYLRKYFEGYDFEEDDLDFFDEDDLPFN